MRTHKYLRPMNAYTTQVRLFTLKVMATVRPKPSTVVYAHEAASARSIEETCSPTIDLEVLFRVRNLRRRLSMLRTRWLKLASGDQYRTVPFTVDVVGSIVERKVGVDCRARSLCGQDHCLIPWTHSRAIWLIRRRSASSHSCKL